MADTNEKALTLRAEFAARAVACVDYIARLTESPIELAMLWAFAAELDRVHIEAEGIFGVAGMPGQTRVNEGLSGATEDGYYAAALAPQVDVDVGGKRYRLDFGLRLVDTHEDRPAIFVAVECDGHDFHERTREQAARDRARDRDLQSIGWIVARFTGSEIFRDPRECARAALKLGPNATARRG